MDYGSVASSLSADHAPGSSSTAATSTSRARAYSPAQCAAVNLISKTVVYPSRKSAMGELKLSVSDLPMLDLYFAGTARNDISSTSGGFDGAAYSNYVNGHFLHTDKFRFLDKACIRAVQDGSQKRESQWRLCTVEQVKIILLVVPIFACTIIFNTVLAQLQTFSVQQGSAMDTHLTGDFQVPPATLQAIPYLMLIVLVPLYEMGFVPLARRFTGQDLGITPLQCIGVGLFTVTFSMVAAALVEGRRRRLALGPPAGERLPIMWIAPQFLIFGLSEMFTAVGLIEFFYKQSLAGMQSFLTAMTYCSGVP